MLDAYIIERLRQQNNRQRGESAQVPLRIEVPVPVQPPRRPEPTERDERGITVIDFTI